jgi:enamine deaminase RidA (YjgF/YER057c/UK114 family)
MGAIRLNSAGKIDCTMVYPEAVRRCAAAARDCSCGVRSVGVTRNSPQSSEQRPILKTIAPRCDRLTVLSQLDNRGKVVAAQKSQYEASRERLSFGERPVNYSEKSIEAEQRLKDLQIELPAPPKPLGAYVESVQSGYLLFLSGTLPIEDGTSRFYGRIGDNLNIDDGRNAARLAVLNALALAKAHLKSLNRVKRVIRLGVSLVTAESFREHPKVADGASELLAAVFGPNKVSTRLVLGVHSLPLGLCVELEVIFEIAD